MLSSSLLLLSFSLLSSADLCRFEFDLTWGKGSPDGYERDMIFVNGQFPGPTLEIHQDDWVEVEVTNRLPFNTTVHWHGIEQINTPEADGVPGVTQWPIRPNETFTYRWRADHYGSYWYHSHSHGQIEDGLFGPIVIKPRPNIPKPYTKIAPHDYRWLRKAEAEVEPVLLSVWNHRTASQVLEDQVASGLETSLCLDSVFVNGKGSVDCWSRQELDLYSSGEIGLLLAPLNLSLTDKGCLPPALYLAFNGPNAGINPTVLLPEIYDACTPTNGSHETIKVSAQKRWKAFDIISAASISTLVFSIDEHPLWVYAVDGHYIEPLKVDSLTVTNGERYSVFVQLDKPVGDYGIRVASLGQSQLIDTSAIFSYKKWHGYGHSNRQNVSSSPGLLQSRRYTNRGGLPTSGNVTAFNESQMVSFPPQFPQPPPPVAQTFKLAMGSVVNAYTFALNATPFDRHLLEGTETPLLYQAPNIGNLGGNTTMVTQNNSWVDLIFISPTFPGPPHPIHKHSNKVFVLGAGEGNFTWSTVQEAAAAIPESFNLVNPPYRDTFTSLAATTKPVWLAVRYHVINPGPFLIHCHIDSHLSGGMAMLILDGVDEWPKVI